MQHFFHARHECTPREVTPEGCRRAPRLVASPETEQGLDAQSVAFLGELSGWELALVPAMAARADVHSPRASADRARSSQRSSAS